MSILKNFRQWWQPPRNISDREDERRVTFLELFYDLVYVVLIAELAHTLSEHINPAGIGGFPNHNLKFFCAPLTNNECSFNIEPMRHKDDSKREAISNAAIELITTIGFADTSMSKIAKAASVSPATIYVYFENKEDLLNQIYLTVKREASEAMLAGYDEILPVKEGFKLIWENACRYMLACPTRFAFSEQFANSPLVNRVSKEEGSEYFRAIFSLFERGKQEGIFKDIPASLFAAFLYAPPMMLGKQHHNGELVLDRELQQMAFEIIWDALTI